MYIPPNVHDSFLLLKYHLERVKVQDIPLMEWISWVIGNKKAAIGKGGSRSKMIRFFGELMFTCFSVLFFQLVLFLKQGVIVPGFLLIV